MKKFIFSLLFVAAISYCTSYCITHPANYYGWRTGIVVDKFWSPHEKVADELILMIRYPKAVERESVDPDTYYKFNIGDKAKLYKKTGEDPFVILLAMVGIFIAVIFILFLAEYKEPEPEPKQTVEKKDKFNFNDYNQ